MQSIQILSSTPAPKYYPYSMLEGRVTSKLLGVTLENMSVEPNLNPDERQSYFFGLCVYLA